MLAPWKKTITILNSLLKGRDISLWTKVIIVKATVFPVIMNRHENWTIKKTALKNLCLRTVVLEKTLESPLDCKEINSVNPNGNQS